MGLLEGGRRISLTVQVGIAAVAGLAIFNYEPVTYLSYDTYGPNEPFVLTKRDCESKDRDEHIPYYKLKSGKVVNFALCFRALKFDNGEYLVPYVVDSEGYKYGLPSYSDDLRKYTTAREASFRLDPLQEAEAIRRADEYYSVEWDRHARDIGKVAAIAIGAVWLISTILGWIVKGFLGEW